MHILKIFQMFVVWLMVSLSSAAVAMSQHTSELRPFEVAINNSDVKNLGRLMSSTVSITIGSSTNIYSKSQAIAVLQEYLEKNKGGDFKFAYSGKREKEIFGVGVLQLNKVRRNLLIMLLYDPTSKNYLLKELKIE